MRTFVYSDANSHKFWNIELKGKSFTVTFGRQGTQGQSQTKTFPDESKAKKEHDKLVAEKLRKGYVETTPAATAAPATPAGNLRDALEEALVANPDDRATHAAYADYLGEQGDPRGELTQVQLALEGPKLSAGERKKLKARESRLLKKHQGEWLGELAPFLLGEGSRCTFEFARGWLDRLHVDSLNVPLARAMVRSPQTRLLRELSVRYVASEGEDNDFEPGEDVPNWEQDRVQFFSLHPLVRSPYLTNVRRFVLGYVSEQDDYQRWEGSNTLGIAAAELIRKMPRVEEVVLWTRGVDMDKLFALPLRELRVLEVYHMNRRHPLEKLAANPAMANLTTLRFHPHHHEEYFPGDEFDPDDAYITRKGVRALLRSPHLGKLTHLQLRLCSMGDRGVQDIVDSGILKRLKVLDLRHGRVTDSGARVLADCPDVAHLERLDLDRNRLSAAGIDALKALGIPDLRVDNQIGPDEDPNQYLFEGDFE